MDKLVYFPEIKYQNINEITTDSIETIQQKQQELDELIKDINIPDQVEFEHKFTLVKPNCCGCGKYSQKSEFNIQGIGKLEFFIDKEHCITLCCLQCILYNCYICCCCCCCELLCLCCWYILSPFYVCFKGIIQIMLCITQVHRVPKELYVMENQKIKLEFWSRGLGIIKCKDEVFLNFVQAERNMYDKFCSSFYSSFPILIITSPFDKNYKLTLKSQRHDCPSTFHGECACLACGDLFTTSKKFHVEGLKQGQCEIISFRTARQALAKVTKTQGQCCGACANIDYPRFAVQFESVRQIDKIAIMMGLIHISMFDQWGDDENPYLQLKFSKEICPSRNRVKSVTIVEG